MMVEKRNYFLIFKFLLTIFFDLVILYGIAIISIFSIGIFTDTISPKYDNIRVLVAGLVVGITYFLYFFVIFKKFGQTIAMRLFNLKVIPISFDKFTFSIVLAFCLFMVNPLTAIIFAFYLVACKEYSVVDLKMDQSSNG